MSDRATVVRKVTEYTGAQGPPYGAGVSAGVAVMARTDPNEQENVVLQPALETKIP